MSSLRDKVKSAGYGLGPLGLYHVLMNRTRLTVVMFHRVLPRGAPERRGCESDYVLDADIFDQCLSFFARHYTVVSLDRVLSATRGQPLPGWPLLITFDDGWMDTFTYAAPILLRRKMPAVCFVVSDALSDTQWWQNSYALAWQARRATLQQIETVWKTLGLALPVTVANPFLQGLALLADLPDATRHALVQEWISGMEIDSGRQMMQPTDLPQLLDRGVAIGAHGASHIPMTLTRDPAQELRSSRSKLQQHLERDTAYEVDTLSFPHGRFDTTTVAAARACGYSLMFTSAAHLSELSDGQLETDICGRTEIATRHVAPDGIFRPDLLACRLFLRPAVRSSREAITAGMTAIH